MMMFGLAIFYSNKHVLLPEHREIFLMNPMADLWRLSEHVNNSLIRLTDVGFTYRTLSGLNNAVFSSMLLGATLKEAKQKVPDIDFSELGEFASHPVRTYSSGMRAWLAFSTEFGN